IVNLCPPVDGNDGLIPTRELFMSYFSRLTKIVTCNISELLTQSENSHVAIGQIIEEIEEGLAGARRSVATAAANEDRVYKEIQEQRELAESWSTKAKD